MPKGEDRMAQLFAAHSASAGKIAYLMTGDRELAQDIVQDAFVRLFGRLRHLRDPDAFPFYLRRTVINLAKDHHRRQSLSRRHEPPIEDGAPPSEDIEDVRSALERLPTRQRAAIVLRYLEGLSESETAEALDCSIPAVKSLVTRGKAAMAKALEVRVD